MAPDPAPRGRAKRLKAEAEPAEECPAAQWCDFGAWAEKTDPGIQVSRWRWEPWHCGKPCDGSGEHCGKGQSMWLREASAPAY